MQALSDSERTFLERRRRLVRRWPAALLGILLLLAGTWLFLFFRHPALANSSWVIDAISAGTLSSDVMQLSAAFLPLVTAVLFFVLVVMLLFLHLTVRNERRYQAIIRRLRQADAGAPGPSSQAPAGP
jgi:hypothetical protein